MRLELTELTDSPDLLELTEPSESLVNRDHKVFRDLRVMLERLVPPAMTDSMVAMEPRDQRDQPVLKVSLVRLFPEYPDKMARMDLEERLVM